MTVDYESLSVGLDGSNKSGRVLIHVKPRFYFELFIRRENHVLCDPNTM